MKSLLIAVTLLTTLSVFADHNPQHDEMMKAWQEYATPGEAHKVLAKAIGNWKFTSKMWDSATSTKPQESSGTSTMKMIMGGRWLQQNVNGNFMKQKFEGMGFNGYDNLTKKYTSIWFDSMGTGIMHGTGTFDSATQTLSDSGNMTCPQSKKSDHQEKYRTEWKFVDKNTMTFTMWGPDVVTGQEFKNMELTYKRK